MLRFALASLTLALAAPAAAELAPQLGGGECVPFARALSGVQIYGNAWTWWDQAEGRYERGHAPRPGAVLVFRPHGAMRLGHVSVVSRVVGPRILMVTHSNWSRIAQRRGQAERDVTLTDVSDAGDWSLVKVWYHGNEGLGGSIYPTYGFIYGTGRPAPGLSGDDPDYIGAVIDAVG